MSDDTDINDAVNQLLGQLNQTTQVAKKAEETEDPLEKEGLEKFLLKYSSRLVKGSVDFVDELQTYIGSTPTAEDVESMAKLVAASATAIESLNKVFLSKKDVESKVALKNMDKEAKVLLKNMDIESKRQLQQIDMQGKLLMNREDLLKKLLDDADLIDADVTEVPKQSTVASVPVPVEERQP